MDPVFFQIAVALAGALGTWMLKKISDELSELKKADSALATQVNTIAILVAGEYAKKVEVSDLSKALFVKLDRIEDKLDKKVDKE